MAEYLIQDTTLDAIADAINAKTGGSSAMTPAEMVTAIGSISGGGSGGVEVTLVGETPLMNSNSNQNTTGICTFDVDGVSFNAILFISKDRTAFKLIPYFQSTTAATIAGMLIFGTSYSNQSTGYVSFTIAGRANADVKTITVNHSRMTGSSGDFYSYHPQKFDIYAVVLSPSSWVSGVS